MFMRARNPPLALCRAGPTPSREAGERSEGLVAMRSCVAALPYDGTVNPNSRWGDQRFSPSQHTGGDAIAKRWSR